MNNLTTGKRIAISAISALGGFSASSFCFWIGGVELFKVETGVFMMLSFAAAAFAAHVSWDLTGLDC